MLTWLALAFGFLATGCAGGQGSPQVPPTGSTPSVLAAESFLADIAQNVAGDRLTVQTLAPLGADPHEYDPSPQELARLSDSNVLILNGAGYESWLEKFLQTLDGKRLVIEASRGLAGRAPQSGEPPGEGNAVDPHFWLDPDMVIRYTENIRDGLSEADPGGAGIYRQNAESYIGQLKELDGWIRSQVDQVPEGRRLLVTNHENLGYFADRYGFKIVGTIIPGVSTETSPSAQQVASLIETIHASGAPAIFLEPGTNPQIAEQIARETGIKIVTGLHVESLTSQDGPAPSYIAMLRHDTRVIIEALKP